MDTTVSLDLNIVAREVGLPIEKVQRSIDLLDDGNTVPFITRYRKDETGGLDEEQIRNIQAKVEKLRQLIDRKQTILKSILSQEKLTEEIAAKIKKAPTQKLLEDLYLPFKPKKQTLATQARQRGLTPLADEILSNAPEAADLAARAAALVDAEKGLADADAVLAGVGHIIAEGYSENATLRGRLRKLIWKIGVLVSTRIEQPHQQQKATEPAAESKKSATEEKPEVKEEATEKAEEAPVAKEAKPEEASAEESTTPAAESETAPTDSTEKTETKETAAAQKSEKKKEKPAEPTPQEIRREKRRRQKERERAKKEKAFKDYFDFREPIAKMPPHRVLAINRGDKTQYLRIKIEADYDQLSKVAEEMLIDAEHTHVEFLKQCLRDALTRLIIPGLEREVRRELTEKAETHAVEVFACNLRKLLLQPPVHNKRVLAIDPGFRSGCKLVALDEFGNILGQGLIHLIGADDRIAKSRKKLVEMIRKYKVEIIAIGNGTACRESEDLVAKTLTDDIKESDVVYLIVNEAGASVYSTSELGREEFPDLDATVRGTISIGRRLLDPLSELVKINPSNIGVGLYQHDVKSKHLRESLDDVVESCVNYVGVDVNKASPALLSYVSGLNQLTARRIYEYRRENGPFKSREDLKKVPGFGDAAFVQAAGFLKIQSPENPLDATWIHPESYEVAEKVLDKLSCKLDQVLTHLTVPAPTEPPADETTESAPAEEPVDATTETPQAEAEKPADAEPAEPAAESTEATAEPTVEPAAEAEVVKTEEKAEEPSVTVIPNEGHKELVEKISSVEAAQISTDLGIGEHLATDLLNSLSRPGRDPRADFPPPLFRRGVMKLEDLEPGMELSGTVLNVVDFGAFVDIGLHDSGMVHISRLANKYVSDPHEVVSVGDILKVWVLGIDKDRRRVSLTAIEPGTEKPEGNPKEKRGPGKRGKPQGGQKKKQGRKPFKDKKAYAGKPKRPSKPKPQKPITEEMKTGKEPLRSFGDLQQFINLKDKDDDKKK